ATSSGVKKKAKPNKIARTPKTPKRSEVVVPESERRRSGRSSAKKSVTYAETDDEDDDEMDWELNYEAKTPQKKKDASSGGESDDESEDQATMKTPSRPQRTSSRAKPTPK